MAPKSGPLVGSNNGGESDCQNIIDLSSGDSESGFGSPHAPRARRSALESPTVEMAEEPAEDFRFRYAPESRTNGSILGIRSTTENTTYPAIRINNYVGPVMICVSCISKDLPYRPHPHKLVGKENCNGGVFTITTNITEENRVVQIKKIGIQCVKRSDIVASLLERKQLKPLHIGDPFKTGFDLTTDSTVGMHHVRLGILVLVPDAGGRCRFPLLPIVSDVITDRPNKLLIDHISHSSGSAHGGTRIFLLTEKLPNQPLTVRFEEPSTGWRSEVQPVLVHKLTSLVVETPPYHDPNTPYPVNVTLQLCRPPSGDPVLDRHMTSDPRPFLYIPDPAHTAPKRPRITEKELHKSLLPPKNHLPHKEISPPLLKELGLQKTMDSMPGPSYKNDVELIKWERQRAFEQELIQIQIQARHSQPTPNMFSVGRSRMGQPSQKTDSNLSISTNGQHNKAGQSSPAKQATPNKPISSVGQLSRVGQSTPVRQTTSNISISNKGQLYQTGQYSPKQATPNRPNSSIGLNSQMEQLYQNIPRDQISTNEQFLLTGQLYSTDPSGCVKRQPTPNGSITSIGRNPQTGCRETPVRHITPNGSISTIGSPLMGLSIPNEQYSTNKDSFLNRQISQLSSAGPSPMGSYMGDMEQHSPIEYNMPPQQPIECPYDYWGQDSPGLNRISLDQFRGTSYGAQMGSIFPEIEGPMSHDGPMEQYFSPESQQNQMMSEQEPAVADGATTTAESVPEILTLDDTDIEALMNDLKELTTSERRRIAEVFDNNLFDNNDCRL